MSTKVGATLAVDGTSQFKQAINNANASLKTMDAEMQKVTASFAGNEKSMEALTAQNDVLTRRSDELNKKLEIQNERLQKLKDAGIDPSSASYQKLQADIYKTEAELIKNDKALKDNNEHLKDNGKNAEEAGEKHDKFSSAIKGTTAALAAMAAAALSAVGTLAKMVIDIGQEADELNTLSKQTGLSTEELQKFQYASGVIDVSVETLTGSMTKLTRQMASAKSGSGAAAEAFKKLGVSVTNSDGSLRDRQEVFNETIEALGKIENAAERDALSMEIFGKSAQDLNPLILGGAEALQELGDRAEEAGLILDQKTLDSLNDVSDAVDILKSTASGAKKVLLAGFAQPVAGAINELTGYMERLTKAFNQNGFEGMTDELGRVLEDGLSYISNNIGKVTEMGTKIIKTLAEALIKALPDLASAGVEMITTLVDSIANDLPQLIPLAAKVVGDLVVNLVNAAPKLISTGLTLITKLAEGVVQAIPVLVAKVPEIIAGIVGAENGGGLLGAIPDIIEAGVTLLSTLAENADDIIDGIVKALPKIITGIIGSRNDGGLLGNIPRIVDAGVQLISALVENTGEIISALISAIPTIIHGLIYGDEEGNGGLLSAENLGKMLQGGIDLFKGLVSDSRRIVDSMVDLLSNLVGDIVKKLLDFAGQFFGLGEGWADEAVDGFLGEFGKGVKAGLGGLFDFLTFDIFAGEEKQAQDIQNMSPSGMGGGGWKAMVDNASQPVPGDISRSEMVDGIVNGTAAASYGGGSGGRGGNVQTNIYLDSEKVAQTITPAVRASAAAAGTPFASGRYVE